jgi:hypothetical protein
LKLTIYLDQSEFADVDFSPNHSLVKQKDVGTHADTGNSKDPCPYSAGSSPASHLTESIVHFGKNVVDKFATTVVLVRNVLNLAFALGSHFVKIFTHFRDGVTVVVGIVIVDCVTAGKASRGDKCFSGKAVSIVHLFISSRRSFLGTGRVCESSSKDTFGGTVSTNIVDLVVTAVLVVVVVVSSILFVDSTAFANIFHFFLFLILRTVAHALIAQTLVLAAFVVIAIVLVVTVFAIVFTSFLSTLASTLVLLFFGLLVRFNEFVHVNNVFSGVATRAARVRRTELELGQKI